MELDMKQVLTPEQREKVMQFREENRQKMIERRKAMRTARRRRRTRPSRRSGQGQVATTLAWIGTKAVPCGLR